MLDGFELVQQTPLVELGADPKRALLLLIRKPGHEATAAEIEHTLQIGMQLLGNPRGWSILFDTRAVVGRSGPEFEQEVARLRAHMLLRYRRIAVLVRSAAGMLQVGRMRARQERMQVFRELDQALAFLTEPDA